MARIVDFFDGAQSETTPTIGNIIASGIITYPDDATYEATEQGAPENGNLYFNTTIYAIRYYSDGAWSTIIDNDSLQTLINKTINADNNTITNLEDDNIKTGAAINAEKIASGSVDNTEFSYLDGVSSNIQTQLNDKQSVSEKAQPNGYASLDGSGLVPASQLPSYVDDVLEFSNFASLPVTGESGKIYVILDDNKTYRWTGSVYVEVGPTGSINNQVLIEGGTLSLIENAASAGQVDNQLTESTGLTLNQDFYVAQGYIPASNFTLNSAQFKLYASGGFTGNITLEVWGTLPSGNPDSTTVHAVSDPFDGSTLSGGTGALETFTFSSPFTMLSGTNYALVLNPSAGSGGWGVREGQPDPEPGVDRYFSNTPASTSWSSSSNNDLVFVLTEDASAGGFDLTFSADAYIQNEGFDKTSNTIPSGTYNLSTDEGILYVTVNNTTNSPTNLTINSAEMESFSPGDDDLIIARVVDSGVEIARKLYLEDGESSELQTGLSVVQSISSIDDLNDVDTSSSPPTNNNTLSWDGTNWVPSNRLFLSVDTGGLIAYPVAVNQFGDLLSVTLGKGVWNLNLVAEWYVAGAGNTTTTVLIGSTSNPGNDGTGLSSGTSAVNLTKRNAVNDYDPMYLQIPEVVVATSTTFYFKVLAANNVTNLQIAARFFAEKVREND